ncbi:hypothetical protein HY839_02610 [Candidatus Azambacteria bacterium]|nr:hypothetical protein [Candidatus Azambacteria bacterium]
MVTRKTLLILLALAAVLFVAACVAVFFLYRAVVPTAPKAGEKVVVAQAKYIKGNASFFYPAQWHENDIPASPGMISVQVVDTEDSIVFVASSAEKLNDPKMSGTLVREESITVGGIFGKERRWENMESQTVVFRADDVRFERKYYRFEMFGTLSRKVKMESEWENILRSVQFEKGSEEGITATPQE